MTATAWSALRSLVASTAFVLSSPMVAQTVPPSPTTPLPPAPMQPLGPMGGFVQPTIPPMPHEANPRTWPQPDYFSEALKLTDFKPGEVPSSPHLWATRERARAHIVLPVQTQAFGFSPQFRAVIGAFLDRQLEAAGVDATHQTDVVNAFGPFVRRLDEARIDQVANEHPKQRLVVLYLGHDGIDQAFVTLSVRDANARVAAHKTVALPADEQAAEQSIAAALPGLMKEAGLVANAASTDGRSAARCQESAWTLSAAPRRGGGGLDRACEALVIGSLLPGFEVRPGIAPLETVSPAKLAWLAAAYVYAGSDAASGSQAAIRTLASSQLGLVRGDPTPSVLALRATPDPVVSRLARLLTLKVTTARSPVISTREGEERELARIVDGLPELAASFVSAVAARSDAFGHIDMCAVERAYPEVPMRRMCSDPPPSLTAHTAPASQAEALLYQEWRLASYVQELRVAGVTQGHRARVLQMLQALPADVAQHPYVRRARLEVADSHGESGSFEEQVQSRRQTAMRSVQTVVDLQRNDGWLAAYSLTDHFSGGNLNVANDAEVRKTTLDETRLLEVLRFDLFSPFARDYVAARRKVGDGALFLMQPASQIRMRAMMAGAMPGLMPIAPPPQASSTATAPAVPRTSSQEWPRRLFAPQIEMADIADTAEWLARVERAPNHMAHRVGLAVARLAEGASIVEARKVIDARPADARVESRIAESHAWAQPANVFFDSGELAAARAYYQRVTALATNSESERLAQVRLDLIDGRWLAAANDAAARLRRYESDDARADRVALLFMLGQSDEAWQTFRPRAASANTLRLWSAALVGHRAAGASLETVDAWLTREGVESAQIKFTDVPGLYLHMHAVVDRIPSDGDIAILNRQRVPGRFVSKRWGASAQLARSALEQSRAEEAYAYAKQFLSNGAGEAGNNFMLPLYAWAAWHATSGKDETVQAARAVPIHGDFDSVLAKSMVLALDGQGAESLRYLTAARYALSWKTRGQLQERAIPAEYEYALGAYLMFRQTRNDAYRQRALEFLQAEERAQPYLGWVYGMQAVLSADRKSRVSAACKARFLDPGSYFLKLASASDIRPEHCPPLPWSDVAR